MLTGHASTERPVSGGVLDAARKMTGPGVGALPICGGDERLKGVLTDRDIVVRFRARSRTRRHRGGGAGAGRAVDHRRRWRRRRVTAHDVRRPQGRRLPVIAGHILIGMVARVSAAREGLRSPPSPHPGGPPVRARNAGHEAR
ncbi:CBS domain-containing protein [Streptomyces sp. NPDC059916]|uniref:CBS domain-containing protein n=1 Tax=Streptomyces sp. NPDC059916 TaxID=3347001 RepID=UPI0036A4B983